VRRDLRLPYLVVGTVFLLQLGRLLSFTLSHAVNLLYWDQWDFWTPLFERASLWRTFTWQLGAPRLGVGLVVTSALAGLTRWDARAQALAMVAIVAAAALAALWLKRALLGRLAVTDAVIPILFLSVAQHETLLGATDLSHGPFPLLLAVLICLAWLHPDRRVRYGLVLVLNFLAIYTAFGFFMGLITPALLALDAAAAARAGRRSEAVGAAVACAVAILSLASFFVGYTFAPGVEGFRFPYGRPLAYPWYAALMFANVFGLKARDGLAASVAGVGLVLFVAAVLAAQLGRLVRAGEGEARTSRSIVILAGFSLLFAAGAAVGRVHLGDETAASSRYYLYLLTGVLALYLHLLGVRRAAPRRWGLAVLLPASVVAGFHTTRLDRDTINHVTNGKAAWRVCYLRTADIAGCDAATDFLVYPKSGEAVLKAKLDYLERNRLDLYADPR